MNTHTPINAIAPIRICDIGVIGGPWGVAHRKSFTTFWRLATSAW